MTSLIVHDGERDLDALSNEELLAELAQAIDNTARQIRRLAQVWAMLESRGVDLAHLRSGMHEWLPLVAAGKLAAEALVEFAGRRDLLRAMIAFSLENQREFAAGRKVVTLVRGLHGTERDELTVHRLKPEEIRLVFSEAGLRPETEQLHLLQDRSRRQKRRVPEVLKIRLAPDEFLMLKRAAAAQNIQVPTLVKDTLRAQKLLE